ncbi:MAG: hypothetical protein JSV23_03380 [Promethearchaeota archaeon]|nr:MAG: hypothetical protein JSV23_03380 [Candidatus Lokiarchaeota archaeon]
MLYRLNYSNPLVRVGVGAKSYDKVVYMALDYDLEGGYQKYFNRETQ